MTCFEPALSRRELARRVCATAAAACVLPPLLASLVAGCGSASALEPVNDDASPPADPATVTADSVVIRLDFAPSLAAVGGHLFVPRAQLVVLHAAQPLYRAFSNICTHAGCGINRFDAGRLICPCHGSEYDGDGRVVAGPAPLPLEELPVQFNAAASTVLIVRRVAAV